MPVIWALLIVTAEVAVTLFVLGGILLPAFGVGTGTSNVIAAAVAGGIAVLLWSRLRAAPR